MKTFNKVNLILFVLFGSSAFAGPFDNLKCNINLDDLFKNPRFKITENFSSVSSNYANLMLKAYSSHLDQGLARLPEYLLCQLANPASYVYSSTDRMLQLTIQGKKFKYSLPVAPAEPFATQLGY